MIVIVERCQNNTFRLTIPSSNGFKQKYREFVRAEEWNRKTASIALSFLEAVYHLNRKNIRFKVK